jgi:hypothetical protein
MPVAVEQGQLMTASPVGQAMALPKEHRHSVPLIPAVAAPHSSVPVPVSPLAALGISAIAPARKTTPRPSSGTPTTRS